MTDVASPGSAEDPGSPPRARRTLLHYVASCRYPECGFLPSSPRQAHIHVQASPGHSVVETKHYVLEMPE